MQEVTGNDLLFPEKAPVLGPCRILSQEHPDVSTVSIDIDLRSQIPDSDIDLLVAELLGDADDRIIAYRGGHRWIETYELLPERSFFNSTPAAARLRDRGVYLVTGGLGRIGLVLAEFLVETAKARVVLTTRRCWPPDGDDDETRQIIARLGKMRKTGGDFMIVTADSENQEEMRRAIEGAISRFGALHGVFHAPAVGRERSLVTMQDLTPEETRSHFAAKVQGTYVLCRVLEGLHLDFCILFSSLSSMLGGLGFCAYAAANVFQDAFAYVRRRCSSVPWLSVNMEGWQLGTRGDEILERTIAEYLITPQEGCEVFKRLPYLLEFPQVAVSTGDLQARIKQWTSRPARPTPLAAAPRTRSQTFIPPEGETELTIARIWSAHLGITEISANDNFFKLGGTSLLATHCMSQLAEELGAHVPLRSLFEAQTVRALAERVTSLGAGERAVVSHSLQAANAAEAQAIP